MADSDLVGPAHGQPGERETLYQASRTVGLQVLNDRRIVLTSEDIQLARKTRYETVKTFAEKG